MSGVFCKRLTDLCFHPNWLQKLPLFVYGLQYAVILRTNDRRTWHIDNQTNETFWDMLIQVIYEKRGQNVSMHDIHGEARKRLRDSGHLRPHYSRFMAKLEEMFPVEMYDAAEAPGPLDPYKANSTDLLNVENVLTSMDHHGLPIYGGLTGDHWGGLTGKNLMRCPDKDTIHDFHERGILITRRIAGRESKRRTRLGDVEAAPAAGATRDVGSTVSKAEHDAMVAELRAEYDAVVKRMQAEHDAKVAEIERLQAETEKTRAEMQSEFRAMAQSHMTMEQCSSVQSSQTAALRPAPIEMEPFDLAPLAWSAKVYHPVTLSKPSFALSVLGDF
ncbi:hypothetical protein BDP55DRAFT_730239 [Colletotrichum godetiae]|uniref:Uncharacterized protein n=1 Tax=Colletotrichum godetiae TaxID=1209918 RepID=A0AAJ0AH21_9PEZI|nr:uncharacterized protein BDP55DRAFT_730239 [Colletotrichum godetiae]KAK1673751.1 hypothetical protein BDP55DRAFT_730239 [Colletotrichum godetiae]